MGSAGRRPLGVTPRLLPQTWDSSGELGQVRGWGEKRGRSQLPPWEPRVWSDNVQPRSTTVPQETGQSSI